MTTFVLVHSAWLGAWAWNPVRPLLEQAGHNVVAIDLPGHGEDRTPPAAVSMDAYVKAVTDTLDAQRDPVILVGHSLGGIIVSQAAEYRPDKVRALVYLCAFLLPSGGSFMEATKDVKESMVLDNLVMAENRSFVTVNPDVMHEAFAHDVPADVFAQAEGLLAREPVPPLSAPLSLTEERWGRLPRYYIECLADRAIPPAVQRAMYTAVPVRQIFSLDTSHTPNFSAPEELASCLLDVVRAKAPR